MERLTHSLEENPGNVLSVLRVYSEQTIGLPVAIHWFDVKKPLVSQQQISGFSMTNQWFLNDISMVSQRGMTETIVRSQWNDNMVFVTVNRIYENSNKYVWNVQIIFIYLRNK